MTLPPRRGKRRNALFGGGFVSLDSLGVGLHGEDLVVPLLGLLFVALTLVALRNRHICRRLCTRGVNKKITLSGEIEI